MTRFPTSSLIFTIVIVAALLGLSALTGFGDWINGHPVAAPAIRVVAMLLAGGGGLYWLVAPPRDARAKPVWFRIGGLFLLVIAGLNAAVLLGIVTPS
jgi:hypothetical protein